MTFFRAFRLIFLIPIFFATQVWAQAAVPDHRYVYTKDVDFLGPT